MFNGVVVGNKMFSTPGKKIIDNMKSFRSTRFENPSLYLVLRDNILVKESNMNANGRNNFCIQHLCCLHKSRKKFYNTIWFISLQLHRILH